MDLRVYYQKIRDEQAKIADEFPIVVSNETTDGGKQGTMTEVPRRLAAKLVVEGTAKIATTDEAAAFRKAQAVAKQAAEQLAASSRLQLTVVSSAELDKLKGKPGVTKG